MNVFEKVYGLLADQDALVAFANSEGGENIPAGDIRVAQKAAALIGAHGAAGLYCLATTGEITEAKYIETLRRFAAGELGQLSGKMANFTSHITWLASQPFRGPDKIERIDQFVFPNLSPAEAAKDTDHVVRAAKFLCERLGLTELAKAA